ncbi:hypothetical protein EVAR_49975_1 [Eumeta japonica]|uniref:Uncharacterized protein n=1 Tax=Eumeta variegata TaxID=151549 RepID=A0A4C1YJ74_EUMVA|nr:hypothetical protein EVAR_49975_1 [Eumeta japonica]
MTFNYVKQYLDPDIDDNPTDVFLVMVPLNVIGDSSFKNKNIIIRYISRDQKPDKVTIVTSPSGEKKNIVTVFEHRLCAAAVSLLLLGRIGRWSGREIARSALSLERSAQAERDNESCFLCVQPAFIDL